MYGCVHVCDVIVYASFVYPSTSSKDQIYSKAIKLYLLIFFRYFVNILFINLQSDSAEAIIMYVFFDISKDQIKHTSCENYFWWSNGNVSTNWVRWAQHFFFNYIPLVSSLWPFLTNCIVVSHSRLQLTVNWKQWAYDHWPAISSC